MAKLLAGLCLAWLAAGAAIGVQGEAELQLMQLAKIAEEHGPSSPPYDYIQAYVQIATNKRCTSMMELNRFTGSIGKSLDECYRECLQVPACSYFASWPAENQKSSEEIKRCSLYGAFCDPMEDLNAGYHNAVYVMREQACTAVYHGYNIKPLTGQATCNSGLTVASDAACSSVCSFCPTCNAWITNTPQSSGDVTCWMTSGSVELQADPTRNAGYRCEAAPTPAPTTQVPTGSRTGSPTDTPTPAPTPAPAEAKADAGGPPGVAPQPQVGGTGDPHLLNVRGQRFDLAVPGVHVLLQIPRAVHPEQTLVRVEADAQALGGACADMYFQNLNITGAWARAAAGSESGLLFSVSAPPKSPNTGWIAVGKVDLKVVWGSTSEGTHYLNVFVRHLTKAGYSVGGLLGEDDHMSASTPSGHCKASIALLESPHEQQQQLSGSVAEAM